jgi:hypothetical protein
VLGLLGVDGGLVWLIAGVWTLRWLGGRPVGLAWALAIMAAAVRWGTISVADIFAASRVLGPAVAVEPFVTAVGCGVALGAALAEESALDGLRSPDWPQRTAAAAVLLCLVAMLAAPGPGAGLPLSLVVWIGTAALGTWIVLVASPLARRIPSWAPVALGLAGLALTGLDR